MKKIICIIALAFSASGCAQMAGIGVSTITGALLGGITGAQFGSGHGQIWAGAAGTLLGAMVGNSFEPGYKPTPPPLPADQAQYLKEEYGYNPGPGFEPIYITQEEVDRIEAVFPKQPNGKPACKFFSTSRNGGYPAIGLVCLDNYGRWRIVDTGSDFYDYSYDQENNYSPNGNFTIYDGSPIYDN